MIYKIIKKIYIGFIIDNKIYNELILKVYKFNINFRF